MSIETSLVREERILEDDLNEGRISLEEYNHAMRSLQRDARAAERDEAERR